MEVSVVIPTYNRCAILQRTLLLYDSQVDMAGKFEVIVVDDGSNDGTVAMLAALLPRLGYALRYFSLPGNAGPGAARNRAIAAAQGRILLFAGDDILPTANFLREHREAHTLLYQDAKVGVLGLVRWAEELGDSPFLRWLEEKGAQFAFGDLSHGDKVDYRYLYTSNISLKRSFLLQTQEYFDERLRFCEDSEWGLRLFRKGFELRYHADALGRHFHPTTLTSSLQRAEAIGKSGATLRLVSPENFARVTGGLFSPEKRAKRRLLHLLLHPALGRHVYAPLARLCERRVPANRLYALSHASYFLKGLSEAGVT